MSTARASNSRGFNTGDDAVAKIEQDIKSTRTNTKKEPSLKAALLADYKIYKKQFIKNPLKSATTNLFEVESKIDTTTTVKEITQNTRIKPLFNVKRMNVFSPTIEPNFPTSTKETIINQNSHRQYLESPSTKVELQFRSKSKGHNETKTKKLTIVFDRLPIKSRAESRGSSCKSRNRQRNEAYHIKSNCGLETKEKSIEKVSSSKKILKASRASPLSKVLSQLEVREDELLASEKDLKEKAENSMRNSQINYSSMVSVLDPKSRAAIMVWEKYKVTKGISTYLHVVDGKVDQTTDTYEIFRQRNWQRWGDVIDLFSSAISYFKEYNRSTFRLNTYELERLLDVGTFHPGFPTESQLRTLLSADLIFALETEKKQVEERDKEREDDSKFSFERSVFIIQRYIRRVLARRLMKKLQHTKYMIKYISGKLLVRAKYTKTRALISKIYQSYEEGYGLLDSKFREIFLQVQNKQRIEIHINSLGYSSSTRSGLRNFQEIQTDQIQRLARLKDPNLNIIFVTFDGLLHSKILYHAKMLEVFGVRNILKRIKFVKLVTSCH